MKIRFQYIAVFCCVMLGACVESATINFPDLDTQLVLMSDFSPDQNISIELSTSVSPCCASEVSFPENARIEIFEEGILIGELTHDRNLHKYLMQPPYFPKVSSTYDVKLETFDQLYPQIHATSYVPSANRTKNLKILEIDSLRIGSKINYTIIIELEFEIPAVLPAYFHLISKRRRNSLEFDLNAEKWIVKYDEEVEELETSKIITQTNSAHVLNHMQGFLLDYAKLNQANIQIKISTTRAISFEEEVFNEIEIYLKSITRDYFDYHKAISQSLSLNGASLPIPVHVPTNVENGLGLFSGSNTQKDVFSIR